MLLTLSRDRGRFIGFEASGLQHASFLPFATQRFAFLIGQKRSHKKNDAHNIRDTFANRAGENDCTYLKVVVFVGAAFLGRGGDTEI